MWQYHPSPRLTWSHTKRVPCGMVSPGVKENPRSTSRLPQCCRTLPSKPTSVLSHKEYWENLWDSTTRDQVETEEMRGFYSNQCSDLCRPQSCLQWLQSRDPSQWLCPSAELRQWPIWPGSSILAVMPDMDPQSTDLTHQGAHPTAPPKEGSKVAALSNC